MVKFTRILIVLSVLGLNVSSEQQIPKNVTNSVGLGSQAGKSMNVPSSTRLCRGVKNSLQLAKAIQKAPWKQQHTFTVCNDILLDASILPLNVSNRNIIITCFNRIPAPPCQLDAQGSGKGILWGNDTMLELANIDLKNSGAISDCERALSFEFHNIISDLGAMTFNNSVIKVRDTLFTNNSAFMGGAINLLQTSLLMTGRTVFDGNYGCMGGAISAIGLLNVLDESEETIKNSFYVETKKGVVFRNNRAIDAGAISVLYYNRVSLDGTIFEKNYATAYVSTWTSFVYHRFTSTHNELAIIVWRWLLPQCH
jgi:hypothetical protein